MASNAEEVSQKISSLSLQDKQQINILLLGETGAGKSTFINSVFNYLQFEEFTKAESKYITVPIPVNFIIEDKDDNEKNVKFGPKNDVNEDLRAGESATQAVKTYIFTVKTKSNKEITIRLIDTPGMGDTRGIEVDNQNCENILNYINGLHHLHAICYLLKSQQSRSTSYFNYCVSQILSRLEKSAGKNIIFVFTHSKGSNYKAGDSLQLLRKLTEEIRKNPAHAEIPLDRNAFCFDNEGFRALCAIKTGVKLSEKTRKWSIESWNHSTKECWKMIEYIMELPPHFVHHTSAINEARRIIHQLSKPMADIAEFINVNINILQKRESDLDVDKNSLEKLKQKMYIPIIDLKVVKLTQPVTVCTDNNCTETYPVGEEGKRTNHYKTRCHDPCYLPNIPRDFIGSPELMNCSCIDKVDQTCTKCGHSYKKHMHVYYFTLTQQTQRVDPIVMASINTKELIIQKAHSIINDIRERKNKLEEELQIIITTNAKFACFLSENVITPYSDHYAEYINYLMDKERSLGENCDRVTLTNLQKLLMEHKAMVKSFQAASSSKESYKITPQEISKSMNTLFKLKINGPKIRELFDTQKKSKAQEYAHSTQEYLHEKVFEQSSSEEKTKKKQFDSKKGQSSAKNPTTKFQRDRPNPRGNYQQRNQERSTQSPPPPYHEIRPHPPPLVNYPMHGHPNVASAGQSSGPPNKNSTIQVQVTIPATAPNAGGSVERDLPPRDPYYPRDYPHPQHPDPYYRYPRDYPPPPRDYPPGYDYPRRDGYDYPPREYPPRDAYPPREYPPRDAYPPREYPPRDAYPPREYPPRDAYPLREYPPRDAYPPIEYPPRDAYPPREGYPPRDPYPPRDQHYVPPTIPDPRYPAREPHTNTQRGGHQKPNFNYSGSNQSRGTHNRGGINRTYRKNHNNNANKKSNS